MYLVEQFCLMLGTHLHKFLVVRVLTVALAAVVALLPATGGRLRLACADLAMASCDMAGDDRCPLTVAMQPGKRAPSAAPALTLADATVPAHACCSDAKAASTTPIEPKPAGHGHVLLPREHGPIPDCCIVRSSAPASMPPLGRVVAAAELDVLPLLPIPLTTVVSAGTTVRWSVVPVDRPPPCPATLLSAACLAAQPPPDRA